GMGTVLREANPQHSTALEVWIESLFLAGFFFLCHPHSVSGMSELHDATPADLVDYHKRNAGRLIIDPAEARKEFGDAVASKLKLTADGTIVLWPQPSAIPEDPQNWSTRRKGVQLLIVTLASAVPDFIGSIGVASIFALSNRYGTTPARVNEVSSNWAILLLGWGGFAAVIVTRRWGRLPVLFWSQLLAFAFLLACMFSPTLPAFAATRCIAAFFSTAPQITGMYTVTDMYPFHLQARMLNLWTMGFIMSPFVAPFVLGFLVAHVNYEWAYSIGAIYSLLVLILIFFLGEETMYNRSPEQPAAPSQPRNRVIRIRELFGLTDRPSITSERLTWYECVLSLLNVAWRPHTLLVMIYGGVQFGLSIGITMTNATLLGEPRPLGFGLSETVIAGTYATPIAATVAGEIIGRYGNDLISTLSIRRNAGVFEAEMRLWMCYFALPLYVTGFLLLGFGFQNHNLAGVIMGWLLGQIAIMLNTTAIYAYLKDCFPAHQGEVSALFNFFRTICGFAVVYFQFAWFDARGGLQVFGCEAAIVAALFHLIVPFVHLRGTDLRKKFSIKQ
ncbi:unnamed protein product, partial [Mycena citricolor]